MKPIAITLFLAFAVSVVSAQTVSSTTADFGRYRKTFRKVVTLDERTYNPFKVQFQQAVSPGKSLTTLTNDEVAKLIGERGIQGVIYVKDGNTGTRAIIGDTVFAVGDEIAFAEDNSLMRLSSNGIVRLKKITKDVLRFEISVTGMDSRTMDYSLANFINSR